MSKKPNTRLIGLFLIIGIFSFIGIIGHVIASKMVTDDKNLVVMYFDESVAGLNIGSSVVFMGVEIGKVARIDLMTNPDSMDFRIPVYAKLEPRKNVQINGFRGRPAVLQELVQKGLRARLTTQSYLTGQLMIELEMMPDTKAVLKQEQDSDLFEIPTVLSPFSKISQGIQDLPIRDSIIKLNIAMDKFITTLDKVNNDVLPNLNTLTTNTNKAVGTGSKDITKTLYNLNQTLSDIRTAAKSLRNFADYIERHPESILKGKKGQ